METIAVVGSPESGKTCTAIGIAAAFAQKTPTQLVDASSDGGNPNWQGLEGAPASFPVLQADSDAVLRQILNGGRELTVIDTRAELLPLHRAAVLASDLVVAVIDVSEDTGETLGEVIRDVPAGTEVVAVLNKVAKRSHVREGRRLVTEMGERVGRELPILDSPIRWNEGLHALSLPGTAHGPCLPHGDYATVSGELAMIMAGA